MDIKTMLIGGGLAFLLWSCGGVSAQEPAQATQPADPRGCYAAALATVRDEWPQLEPWRRAILGAQVIEICEGGQP